MRNHLKALPVLCAVALFPAFTAAQSASPPPWTDSSSTEEPSPDTHYALGKWLAETKGNPAEAVLEYHAAAEQGHAKAQYALGLMFLNGSGVEKDLREGLRWLASAAQKSDKDALVFLAGLYFNGNRDISKNYGKAAGLYRRAADLGVTQAHIRLGEMYLHGWGIVKDSEEAKKWERLAGKNPSKALNYYREAAGRGSPTAQYRLWELQARREEDPALPKSEALEWLKRSADAGNTEALIQLGRLYEEGWDLPPDPAAALRYYRLAADKGSGAAFYRIGHCHYEGKGVPQDDGLAMKYFLIAAADGRAEAQFKLGVMYENGQGVEKNMPQALRWFRKAAEGGEPKAQYYLGTRYQLGLTVRQDDVEADKWYVLASEKHVLAENMRRKIERRMTAPQIAQARTQAKNLQRQKNARG